MAFRVKDEFHSFVLAGLAMTFGIQVFLTIGGGSRLIPLTGVTLPLISMGGSSLTATILMFSVLHGIYIKEFTNYDEEELQEASEEMDAFEENPIEEVTAEMMVVTLQDDISVDSDVWQKDTKVISKKSSQSCEVRNENDKTQNEVICSLQEKDNTMIKPENKIEIKTERKNEMLDLTDEIESDWEKDEFQGNARKDW